jgi:hypothetical protein
MAPEESAVAKSTGMQDEQDLSIHDTTLFRVLSLKKKYRRVRLSTRNEKDIEKLTKQNINAQNASLI